MAGDWIKVEKGTPEKPEILAVAAKLNLSIAEVFLGCFKLWRWADSQTLDGSVPHVTPELLDSLSGLPGFSHALLEVGWLQARSGSLVIPHFARHMGQSAKRRALTAARVAAFKSRHSNDNGNAPITLDELPRVREDLTTTTTNLSSLSEEEEQHLAAFLDRWNRLPGVRRRPSLTPPEIVLFRDFLTDEAKVGHLDEALRKVAKSSKLQGKGRIGQPITVSRFLDSEIFWKILAGEYGGSNAL